MNPSSLPSVGQLICLIQSCSESLTRVTSEEVDDETANSVIAGISEDSILLSLLFVSLFSVGIPKGVIKSSENVTVDVGDSSCC